MLLNVKHLGWSIGTAIVFAVSLGLYCWYAGTVPNGPSGGSWQGLLFGIVGSALMLFAGLLGMRKKVPAWRVGTAQTWLRAHIWLGLLSVPMILFHSGFRFGGWLEQVLMAVFALVIVSGIVGLGLQQWLPRLMTGAAKAPAIYDQLPVVCQRLETRAEDVLLAKKPFDRGISCGPLWIVADPQDRPEAAAVKTTPPAAAKPSANDILARARQVKEVTGADAAAPPADKPAESTPKPAKPSPADILARARQKKGATGETPPETATEPSAKPAKPSTADILARARQGKAAAGVAPGDTAGEPTPKPAKPSTAEILARARQGKGAASPAEAAAPPEPAAEPAPKPAKPSTAEILARARQGKGSAGPSAADAPADGTPGPAQTSAKLSTADILARARQGKSAAAADPPPAVPADPPQKPAKPSTADILARARQGKGATDATATASPVAVATKTPAKPATADILARARKGGGAAPAAVNSAASATAGNGSGEGPNAAGRPSAPGKAAKTPAKPTPAATGGKPVDVSESAKRELREFFLQEVRPFLRPRPTGDVNLIKPARALARFSQLEGILPQALQPQLAELKRICDERRSLLAQEKYQKWLHGWLLLHVPLSMALLVLGILHAVMSLYY